MNSSSTIRLNPSLRQPFLVRVMRFSLASLSALGLSLVALAQGNPLPDPSVPTPAIATLRVTETGIQRVTAAELAQLGLDITGIPVDAFALFRQGQPVPVRAVADSNTPPEPADRVFHGGFDPAPAMTASGYLEFVGQARKSLYQDGEMYVLKLGQGVPMPQDTRLPDDSMTRPAYYWQETTLAPDTAYSFAAPIEDPWYAKRLLSTAGPLSETLTVPVSRPYQSGPAATVSVRVWGGTDYPQVPDHHVQLAVNGRPVADALFDGITAQEISQPVSMDQLAEGDLPLTVTLPRDLPTAADLVHVESWSIRYPRQPVLMDGALQLETDQPAIELRGARQTAYAIYRQRENGQGQWQRISHYQLRGHCSAQASDDCTLRFVANGTGQNGPARYVIQSQDAIHQPVPELPPMPEDIVSDKADYLIIAHPDFIGPALQPLVDHHRQQGTVKVVDVRQIYAWFSHYNVDAQAIADYIAFAVVNMGTTQVLLVGGDSYDYQNKLGLGAISFVPTLYAQTDDLIRYAPVDAKLADVDNDNVPDVALGRLLVRSEDELQAVVNKILTYENKTYGNSAVFAADQYDAGQGYSFKQDALDLIATLPADWQNGIGPNQKAFVDDDGVAQARAKITQAIEQGVALTSFVGHSGPRDWTYNGLFKAADALALNNDGKPTLVTQWGCWNTYFVSPQEDTMAHAFMLNANGGAAAVLGASTLTQADAERGLAKLVLRNLTSGGMNLGQAVLQAKQEWATQHPEDLDVILGWNILGDPATRL